MVDRVQNGDDAALAFLLWQKISLETEHDCNWYVATYPNETGKPRALQLWDSLQARR